MTPLNVAGYAALARQQLSDTSWDYFAGGSEDEHTLHSNVDAFGAIRLRPRVLVDVETCSTATQVLDTPLSQPMLLAPVGCLRLAHPDGECAVAQAAGLAGTIMVVSTMATTSIEAIAAAATGPLWFQLYVFRDRQVSIDLIKRAEAARYQALVLTVDAPRLGRRERDMRNQFSLPAPLQFANFAREVDGLAGQRHAADSALARHAAATFDASLTWDVISWLRRYTSLPIVVKGILTAEDARLAVEHGANAIIVSNHGGRQLDGALATITALPEVVGAVAGRCDVYLDGGVRRGTDVLKALALGARAVLVGRPYVWGLAAGGSVGVTAVLELLREELECAMRLAGRPTLAQIDHTLIARPGH